MVTVTVSPVYQPTSSSTGILGDQLTYLNKPWGHCISINHGVTGESKALLVCLQEGDQQM